MIPFLVDQRSTLWHLARKNYNGINASELGSIFNVSDFKSFNKLKTEKKNPELQKNFETASMKRGNEKEKEAIEFFVKNYKKRLNLEPVVCTIGSFQDPVYPLSVSPDAVLLFENQNDFGLEIKIPNTFNIPLQIKLIKPEYILQVMACLMTLKFTNYWILFFYNHEQPERSVGYIVQKNPDLYNDIIHNILCFQIDILNYDETKSTLKERKIQFHKRYQTKKFIEGPFYWFK